MKKFFTLIAAVAMAASMNAQGTYAVQVGDNVKAGELSICPMKNGAIFTCAEDVKVNLFDLNGRLVKNFNLNGSEFVELAAGIYIANGKKFIVK